MTSCDLLKEDTTYLFLNTIITTYLVFFKKKSIPNRFLGDMLSKKKPFVDSPSSASQGKDKKMKKMVFPGTGNQGLALPETETAENDEDYEPTAMLGMMSEFQREAGITAPKEAVNSSKHASLSVSTVI